MSQSRSDSSRSGRIFFALAALDLLVCLAIGVWQVSIVVRLFRDGLPRPLVVEGLLSVAAYPTVAGFTVGPMLALLRFRMGPVEADDHS